MKDNYNEIDSNISSYDSLIQAVKDDDISMVSYLLTKTGNINIQENFTLYTPLFTACIRGNVTIINMLLEKHANTEILNCWGETPLHKVSYSKKLPSTILELLLKKGANVNGISIEGYYPLHLACLRGNIEKVKILIEKGGEIDSRTKEGDTSLHIACNTKLTEKPNYTLIKILLDCGANTEILNYNNERAKDLLIKYVEKTTDFDEKFKVHEALDFFDSSKDTQQVITGDDLQEFRFCKKQPIEKIEDKKFTEGIFDEYNNFAKDPSLDKILSGEINN